MPLGTLKLPTIDALRDVAADLGMSLSDDELTQQQTALVGAIGAYNLLDQMPDELPAVKYPRSPGVRPDPADNTHGAWYVKSRIEGAASGKLKGKTVAIKDNICIAGVPMMNGASTLEGYVPDVDATVVQRACWTPAAPFVGKAVCEYFCFSGGSHTAFQRLRCITRTSMGYSAGGSSSGSAVPGRRSAKSTWRWAATRAARSACPSSLLRHLRHEADARAGSVHRHHADRTDASTTPAR